MKNHYKSGYVPKSNCTVVTKKLSQKQFNKLASEDSTNKYCFKCETPFLAPPKILILRKNTNRYGHFPRAEGRVMLCAICIHHKSALITDFISSERIRS
jgi:hypothetical protein